MPSKRSRAQIVLWTFTGVAVAAAAAFALYPMFRTPPPPKPVAAPTQSPIVARFSLVDHTGKAVTQKDFAGRWKLVFFGFTRCPDVCPTGLNTVAQVIERLDGSLDGVNRKLVTLFVSVDPKRDTPKTMAAYVAAFDKRIVGLTGTEAQVAAAAKSFRVYYARVDQKGAPDGYTVNHSSILYLMGPDGRFVTHFRHNDKPAAIAAAIKKEIEK